MKAVALALLVACGGEAAPLDGAFLAELRSFNGLPIAEVCPDRSEVRASPVRLPEAVVAGAGCALVTWAPCGVPVGLLVCPDRLEGFLAPDLLPLVVARPVRVPGYVGGYVLPVPGPRGYSFIAVELAIQHTGGRRGKVPPLIAGERP